ncbi:hypothetical protein [Streptomyces lushanensis]|uniref:hypothetical protein n=1 Tax=Streptomyces lushanensis TaxID=1434255 RepID=UPI00114CC016|nr:hypothetical protein [Streptomyces lushanensis]
MAAEYGLSGAWRYAVGETVSLALAVREAEGAVLLSEPVPADLPADADAVPGAAADRAVGAGGQADAVLFRRTVIEWPTTACFMSVVPGGGPWIAPVPRLPGTDARRPPAALVWLRAVSALA